jgi:EAL domain-containing protein (putative c-di-GMP-specific phosphodiesterase class I)
MQIAEATLARSARSGMKAVGEGVERVDDWQLVRKLACDCAQAHFTSRPMPGEILSHWWTAWQERVRELCPA